MAVTIRRTRSRACRPSALILLAFGAFVAVISFEYSGDSRGASFIDDEGIRRFAPPSPPAASWLSGWFDGWDFGAAQEVAEISSEEVESLCAYCDAFGDFFKSDKFRKGGALGRKPKGLELASGNGKLLTFLREEGACDVVGVDPRIANVRNQAGTLLASGAAQVAHLTKLPYRSNHFDYLIAIEPFGKIGLPVIPRNVDPVLNEATRVAKLGATMVFAARTTLDGTAVLSGETDGFKSRRWWMDTFCAHGWIENTKMYAQLLDQASPVKLDVGQSETSGPRNWFVLKRVKKSVKSKKCRCTVPKGRDARKFCGGEGRKNARDEVKALWKVMRKSKKHQHHSRGS
jgi:ubiquinone/menaquinone biosynthesis C-methylase UbiE